MERREESYEDGEVLRSLKSKGDKAIFTIYDDHTIGRVQISDEVIAVIAALAATDVKGVACMSGGVTREKAARAGGRLIAKGVKVEIVENAISLRLIIIVTYGCNIPETTLKVQQRVKNRVELMTGLTVSNISVSVADVEVESK
ncbi:MAG: Asp23/Gls24 family envelope stress response protein [Eubacterium sp.]|nr:Asp23/Gls24 family envelope stress response protein [Eubacterium sp.]